MKYTGKPYSFLIRLFSLILLTALLAGCATSTTDIDLAAIVSATPDPNEPVEDPRPFLDDYIEKQNTYNFGACYAMLSPDAQENISLIDYMERHQNIYDGIELEALSITYGEMRLEAGKRYLQDATLTYVSPLVGTFTQDVTFSMDYSENDKAFYLNWKQNNIFTDLTSSMVVRVRTLRPQRGEILDSQHNAYAVNSYAETVYAQPSLIEDYNYTVKALSSILNMTTAEIEDKLTSSTAEKYDSAVIKVYTPGGISDATESALLALPGVKVDRSSVTPIRYYPMGNFFSHTMGYTSSITAEEIAQKDPERYDISSYIGRTGLEAAYEDILCGTKGYSLDLYAKDGQRLKTVAKRDKVDGLDLEITLDYDLQKRAEDILATLAEEGNAGTVTVLDPTTGDILATSSFPDFDPNLFIINSDPATLASYVDEESNSPLYNRAIQGSYIPGSTIKPFIAAMCLDNDILNENYEFTGSIVKKQWIPSGYWPYPAITRVSNYSGPVNMSNAITNSDNIYFANAALKTGWDVLEPFLQSIGYDERIPFDLRVSNPSYLSSGNYDNKHLLASTGYGQGELLISPLQMACIFSSFANDGDVMQPRLVKATRRMVGTEYEVVEEYPTKVWREDIISSYARNKIEPMLERVVEEGSGRRAGIDGLTICGKTGTAEIGSDKKREIAWFIAYVKDADYDRLVAVTLELPANYKGTIRYDVVRELLMP